MRTSLKRIISQSDLSGPALRAFTDHPALEELTLQFLYFVPPWVVSGSDSVAESAIHKALTAFENAKGRGPGLGHRLHIESLAESANILSTLRVSVLNSNDQWDIWNYDQPLIEYMQSHKRSAIQIRSREEPIAAGPVLIKLLAAISTTSELMTADLDISSLLNRSGVQ